MNGWNAETFFMIKLFSRFDFLVLHWIWKGYLAKVGVLNRHPWKLRAMKHFFSVQIFDITPYPNSVSKDWPRVAIWLVLYLTHLVLQSLLFPPDILYVYKVNCLIVSIISPSNWFSSVWVVVCQVWWWMVVDGARGVGWGVC